MPPQFAPRLDTFVGGASSTGLLGVDTWKVCVSLCLWLAVNESEYRSSSVDTNEERYAGGNLSYKDAKTMRHDKLRVAHATIVQRRWHGATALGLEQHLLKRLSSAMPIMISSLGSDHHSPFYAHQERRDCGEEEKRFVKTSVVSR